MFHERRWRILAIKDLSGKENTEKDKVGKGLTKSNYIEKGPHESTSFQANFKIYVFLRSLNRGSLHE